MNSPIWKYVLVTLPVELQRIDTATQVCETGQEPRKKLIGIARQRARGGELIMRQ